MEDIEAAQCLVSSAIKCGLKESGITSADGKRVIEVPWSDSNRILLSKECVRFPVDLARQKIGRELERFLVV